LVQRIDDRDRGVGRRRLPVAARTAVIAWIDAIRAIWAVRALHDDDLCKGVFRTPTAKPTAGPS
jgi:hypothetical protein